MSYYRTAADRKAEAARARQLTEESSKGISMWYTVLHSTAFDVQGIRAGGVFECVKTTSGKVAMFKVNADGVATSESADFLISVEGARKYFSKPTKSFTDAMEQSFMVSEAAYC